MDPIGFIIICVALYGMAKRAPGLIGEAVAEVQANRRGETTQAAQDRRQRLIDAGVDPASGGAFRQFAGNAWRDYWVDKDRERQQRRADGRHETGEDTPWWRQRWNAWWQRFDRAADAYVDRLGRRLDAWGRDTGAESTDEDSAGGDPDQDAPDGQRDNGPGPHPDDGPTPQPDGWDTPRPEPDTSTGDDRPGPDTGDGQYGPARPPIRVPATVGAPAAQPGGATTAVLDPPVHQIEGNPMGNAVATNGTAVTGVVSGAAEARSIQRALEAATAAYEAAVSSARRRIHSLGEQTLGVVQMAGRSDVVNAAAQAAEAIAAAQAGVNACKAEVIPLMGVVARHFDRRNS